jgi:hypothetical protein
MVIPLLVAVLTAPAIARTAMRAGAKVVPKDPVAAATRRLRQGAKAKSAAAAGRSRFKRDHNRDT